MRNILLLLIVAIASFTIGNARPATFNATATVTLTLGASNVDQAAANAQRAAVLLDYAKARGLDVYQSDHVTVDPTKVGPAVDVDVKAYFKTVVVEYRAANAGVAAVATQRATDTAAIQP